MQVTSLLSREESERHEHSPSEDCASCGHDHEHIPVHLPQTVAGLIFIINAFIVEWTLDRATMVSNFSAMVGAIILGYPIILTAYKDLRRGLLSINELVAIAVLAAFASGQYEIAGVVSFFMLLGELIESRSAEGARASIESLIKLTPTKARRLTAQGEDEVAASELRIGDVIRIRPGDNVAADGVIVTGQGSFNQANITGESLPVLIVACPCAFILATPTAMVAALSAAARLGILIKNVSDIEAAARVNAFVFDKTGTLTTGKLSVSRLAPMEGTSPADLLRIAATAEKYSNHPTAKALAGLAEQAGVPLTEPADFAETAGRGIAAKVDDAQIVVGRAQWLRDSGIKEDFERSVDVNETEGFSLMFVAREGRCIGWIGLQDETRSEAQESLTALEDSGVRRIAMVTGDRQPVATRVAREIGCKEVVAECLPQNKVEFVRQMRGKGYRVAVVGDGVNDAPALAAGDMGIAMGAAGSEVAIHSATIALMNNDLRRLPFLVRLSRSTRSVINQNFLVGVLFIVGGLTAAAFGYVHPIVAAILHNVGSLIVVFNSARLVRHGEELEPFAAEAAKSGTMPPSSPQPTGRLQPQVA